MSWNIEAVKARCAAARPGPWECDHESWAEVDDISVWSASRGEDGTHDEIICNIGGSIVECVENLQSLADGRFVAHARADLPDAIELIEEAEGLLLDARPVIGGDSEAEWCKRREAFFAKLRPQTKQEGT